MTLPRHSVDDLLVTGQPSAEAAPEAPKAEPTADKEALEAPKEPTKPIEPTRSEPEVEAGSDEYGADEPKAEPVAAASDVDEYGNPVAKPRTYSEEEVQRMIRDRLSRGQHQQPPTQQQVNTAAAGFEYNAESEETWQQQLDKFVRHTVKRMNTEEVEDRKQHQERAITQAFESKFHVGMSKYPDFQKTLTGKPVTDAMMHGIRGLDNPASFLYAAAKQQPGELERISKIPDAYQQIAEMGRLHERMRVKKKQSSNAPAPMKPSSGDISDSAPYKRSIDQMIAEHAKERVRK